MAQRQILILNGSVRNKKALKNGLNESFTEHDLQAKTASDLENLEQGAQLLQHTSSSTTQSIYRRKPDVVLPFKCKTWDNFSN